MATIKKIKTVFQFRRATEEEWLTHKGEVPAAGEPCFDLTNGTLKIGDGVTTYENLKVIGGATISDDGLTLIVEDLQEDVSALQGLVGKESVADQIANAMEDVATTIELQEVINNVTVLESQVTTSNNSVTEMQTIVEQNNTLVAELRTTVEQKADKEIVTELQTIVEQKVDNTAVEQMSAELKIYVDEQIQNIEITNNDYGEI